MCSSPLPASYNHVTHHQSLILILCHQCVVSTLFFLLRFYFFSLWCACDPAYTPWCDLGGTWCILPQSILFVTTNPCHCHAYCLYPTPLLSSPIWFLHLHSMYNIHHPQWTIVVFPLNSNFFLFCFPNDFYLQHIKNACLAPPFWCWLGLLFLLFVFCCTLQQ